MKSSIDLGMSVKREEIRRKKKSLTEKQRIRIIKRNSFEDLEYKDIEIQISRERFIEYLRRRINEKDFTGLSISLSSFIDAMKQVNEEME